MPKKHISRNPKTEPRIVAGAQPPGSLVAGYHEMAQDLACEREAIEWIEALIGDSLAED